MSKLITVTAIATIASSAVKGAKGPAQLVDDVMELVGFGKINEWADKKRAKRDLSVKDYKDKIARGINNIEPDRIKEPKLSIVGPAIEASRFYIEEEEIRDMFANIVVAAMDSSKDDMVHTSFIEIVKQLSPHDAKHLVQISNNEVNPTITLYKEYSPSGGKITINNEFFISDHLNIEDHKLISSSLINLQRLGIIEITRNEYYSEENYKNLIENEIITKLKSELPEDVELKILKGTLQLTNFGINFCDVCL